MSHMLQARRVKGPRVDRGDGSVIEGKCCRASRSAVGRPRHAQHPVCFAPRAATTRVWELPHRGGEGSMCGGSTTIPSLQLSVAGGCSAGGVGTASGFTVMWAGGKAGDWGGLSNREKAPLGWCALFAQQLLLLILGRWHPPRACAVPSSIVAADGTGRDGKGDKDGGDCHQQQRRRR